MSDLHVHARAGYGLAVIRTGVRCSYRTGSALQQRSIPGSTGNIHFVLQVTRQTNPQTGIYATTCQDLPVFTNPAVQASILRKAARVVTGTQVCTHSPVVTTDRDQPGSTHRAAVDKAAHSRCRAKTCGCHCRRKNKRKRPVAVPNRQVQ
jgi:hypothetical protein